jgi:hypothetical protein
VTINPSTPAIIVIHTEYPATTTTKGYYTEDKICNLLNVAQLKGYEEGFEEGQEVRITEAEMLRESQMMSHVNTSTQTMANCTMDSTTQITPTTTVNAIMQTAPNDKMPCLLNDVGMSTEPPSTCETSIQLRTAKHNNFDIL